MLCNALASKSAVSIKTAAGPSAPVRSPSRTLTANVKWSPTSFGVFKTTTASWTVASPLRKTETRYRSNAYAGASGLL